MNAALKTSTRALTLATLLTVFGIFMLVTLAVASRAAAAPDLWLTDYDAALARAKAEGKPVLIDFTGSDWCGWCMALDGEVFSQPQFRNYAKEQLVLLKLDFPKADLISKEQRVANRKLAQKYGIKGYPTIIVLNSEGAQLGKMGYMEGGPPAFLKELKKLAPKKAASASSWGSWGTPAPAAAAPDPWLTDYAAALAKAKEERKPVLIDFTGSDWCGWCIRLDREVFSQAAFKTYAEANLVLLKVDFPQRKPISAEQKAANQKLAEQYGIQGYPTIILLDAEGKPLGQLGYQPGGPAAFVEAVKKLTVKP